VYNKSKYWLNNKNDVGIFYDNWIDQAMEPQTLKKKYYWISDNKLINKYFFVLCSNISIIDILCNT